MIENDPLATYRAKRDLSKTPEPNGSEGAAGEAPIFVVQKHDASHLHYDLRVEIGGVLKSWAVPKGPSMDPKVKRLAIPTEDHPLDYADFEGVIPEGEYGAGTVMVWDIGTFSNKLAKAETPVTMEQSFEKGRLELYLKGKKLRGAFVMIRTQRGGAKPQWLLWKGKDDFAKPNADVLTDAPDSALTGRSLEQIAAQEGQQG
ncbi:MAG: DNA ligase [Candidatus Coatesbacteria bacterium]|nr:DNA ligase [Candidatus Coatesbacteria bacterium]